MTDPMRREVIRLLLELRRHRQWCHQRQIAADAVHDSWSAGFYRGSVHGLRTAMTAMRQQLLAERRRHYRRTFPSPWPADVTARVEAVYGPVLEALAKGERP